MPEPDHTVVCAIIDYALDRVMVKGDMLSKVLEGSAAEMAKRVSRTAEQMRKGELEGCVNVYDTLSYLLHAIDKVKAAILALDLGNMVAEVENLYRTASSIGVDSGIEELRDAAEVASALVERGVRGLLSDMVETVFRRVSEMETIASWLGTRVEDDVVEAIHEGKR